MQESTTSGDLTRSHEGYHLQPAAARPRPYSVGGRVGVGPEYQQIRKSDDVYPLIEIDTSRHHGQMTEATRFKHIRITRLYYLLHSFSLKLLGRAPGRMKGTGRGLRVESELIQIVVTDELPLGERIFVGSKCNLLNHELYRAIPCLSTSATNTKSKTTYICVADRDGVDRSDLMSLLLYTVEGSF